MSRASAGSLEMISRHGSMSAMMDSASVSALYDSCLDTLWHCDGVFQRSAAASAGKQLGCGFHPLLRMAPHELVTCAERILLLGRLQDRWRLTARASLSSCALSTRTLRIAHGEACGSCASAPRSGARASHVRLWATLEVDLYVSDVVRS